MDKENNSTHDFVENKEPLPTPLETLRKKEHKLSAFAKKSKEFLIDNTFVVFLILALWLKTYLVLRYAVDIDLENPNQHLILLISPLAFSIFIYGFTLLLFKKHRIAAFLFVNILTTFMLYGNVLFYQFYTDFVTVPVLLQTTNMGDLGTSVTELVSFSDILYILDIVLFILFILKKPRREFITRSSRKVGLVLILTSVVTLLVNLTWAEAERPELLSRTFDREILVKNLGIFNYHVYDIYMFSKTKAQKALADSDALIEAEKYMETKQTLEKEKTNEYKGIADGKNVIYIPLESLQTFLIGDSVGGKTITPFLNELIKESYYFPHFYHQTAQGKSSDSEFVLDTSMYPLGSGAVFFTHAKNTYQAVPYILRQNGYSTNVFHANNASFWNRNIMYETLGISTYYDLTKFNVTEENSIGWGLKDKEFFEQSLDYLEKLSEPYYAKLITLTNHFPFELSDEDKDVQEWDSNSKTLNKYFTTANYLDRAVESFFKDLKKRGMYEDNIYVLYGDHYGISENHNRAMSKYLNKEKLNSYDVAELQKVPLIIHIPGEKGKTFENVVGGQVDLKPTIMNLLGINVKTLSFGEDLFSMKRENRIAFRGNGAVSDKYVYYDDTCYVRPNYINQYEDAQTYPAYQSYLDEQKERLKMYGNATAESASYDKETRAADKFLTGMQVPKENCSNLLLKQAIEQQYSDNIIFGDLLRFRDFDAGVIADDEKLMEKMMREEK